MNTVTRRPEFASQDIAVVRSILAGAPTAHVAFAGAEGWPDVRPMNFVLLDDTVYLHGAEGGQVGRWAGAAVTLSAEDRLCSVPSYWRHAEMACPASTYYRSVLVRGRLRRVDDLDEKARALQGFMGKYQPEGGHRPVDASDARYQGPLRALGVMALALDDWSCKVKAGQHLTPPVRATVLQRMVERGYHEDLVCAREMGRANPDLALPYPATDDDGLVWRDAAEDLDPETVWRLLSTTYWAHLRDLTTVKRHLRDASLVLSAHRDGALVAMARLVKVQRKVNWIFDVVVRDDMRRQGLGQRLMRRLLSHPALGDATRVLLDTRTAQTLYRRFGFVGVHEHDGSTLMVLHREGLQ